MDGHKEGDEDFGRSKALHQFQTNVKRPAVVPQAQKSF